VEDQETEANFFFERRSVHLSLSFSRGAPTACVFFCEIPLTMLIVERGACVMGRARRGVCSQQHIALRGMMDLTPVEQGMKCVLRAVSFNRSREHCKRCLRRCRLPHRFRDPKESCPRPARRRPRYGAPRASDHTHRTPCSCHGCAILTGGCLRCTRRSWRPTIDQNTAVRVCAQFPRIEQQCAPGPRRDASLPQIIQHLCGEHTGVDR
jgi:hypothetical protein